MLAQAALLAKRTLAGGHCRGAGAASIAISTRLPSPEDILDPGQGSGRSREDRGQGRDIRPPRGEDRSAGPRPKKGKSSPRHVMGEGSVWFRASIGSRKNAEARWLLPMICRRGGIDKSDIGAIRVMDTTTEFEISARGRRILRRQDPASRPRKDNIRIEALDAAPQVAPIPEKRPHAPRREDREFDRSSGPNDRPRDARAPKPHDKPHVGKPYEGKPRDSKPHGEHSPRFNKDAGFNKKKRHPNKPAYGGPPQFAGAPAAKPGFGKKAKKKHRG